MPTDYRPDVIHALIAEGEALRETNDADALLAWVADVRENLTDALGYGHRFVGEVEEAAHGAASLERNAELRSARHVPVLTLVTMAVLRRAADELEFRAKSGRLPMPRAEAGVQVVQGKGSRPLEGDHASDQPCRSLTRGAHVH